MFTNHSPQRATLRFWLMSLLFVLITPASWSDGGSDHQQRLSAPIQLGVSGGSIDDQDGVFCCGGTLGGLLQDSGGNLFILSNNHVLARTNRALIGEDVIQPGLIDVGCQRITQDVVADLADYIPIDFNNANLVDAAIAEIRSGLVDTSGDILDIGPLDPSTLDAFVGLDVKKSGRTTGLTNGTVSAIGVNVVVSYPKKCGNRGGPGATFVNQIRITPGSFSAGGDSGSVVVEDVASNPRPVGLLFAGSSSSTLANPIDDVLAAFGLAMVGGTPPDPGDPTPTPTPEPDPTPTPTPDPGGGEAVVQCVTYDTSGGRNGDKHLNVTISVTDTGGAPLSGAGVDIEVFLNGSLAGVGSGGFTDSNGNVTYSLKNAPDGDYDTVVTSVNGALPSSQPDNLFRKGTDAVPDSDCLGDAPQPSGGSSPGMSGSHRVIAHALRVRDRNEQGLMNNPGVVGTGIGRGEDGRPVIEVYLASDRRDTRAALPGAVEGIPVRGVVTGEFVAY